MASRIVCDGKSPLTQFVNILVQEPEKLSDAIEQDAEAERILTSPALGEAMRIATLRYSTGTPMAALEKWDQRDEDFVNWKKGYIDSEGAVAAPMRRAAEYLSYLMPRLGPPLHDQWFRLAVDEARGNGTAAQLTPLLAKGKEAFARMLDAALDIADGGDRSSEFSAARAELRHVSAELLDYTKEKTATPKTSKGGAPRQANVAMRRQKVLELSLLGKTPAQIESVTGIPAQTIHSDRRELRKKGLWES